MKYVKNIARLTRSMLGGDCCRAYRLAQYGEDCDPESAIKQVTLDGMAWSNTQNSYQQNQLNRTSRQGGPTAKQTR